MTGLEFFQGQASDCDPHEAESWETDCGRHSPDLAVFAFDQRKLQPSGWDVFSESDGRIAGWQTRRQLQQTGVARPGPMSFQIDAAAAKRLQGGFRWNVFHLSEIRSRMGGRRIEQSVVKSGFIGQQKQSFGIEVQTAERVNAGWKPEVGERSLPGLIGRELAQHAVGFKERQQHGRMVGKTLPIASLEGLLLKNQRSRRLSPDGTISPKKMRPPGGELVPTPSITSNATYHGTG